MKRCAITNRVISAGLACLHAAGRSCVVPTPASATVAAPSTQVREIRTTRDRGRIRKRRDKKRRHVYSNNWQLQFDPSATELHKIDGHELDAYEAFGKYADDARVDPSLLLHTAKLSDLPPLERYNQLIPIMGRQMEVRHSVDAHTKVRLLLQMCETFEDYSETTGLAFEDMPTDHQEAFTDAATGLLMHADLAYRKVRNDGAAAAVLRLADIADSLGQRLLRDRCLAQCRGMVAGVERGYDRDVPVSEPPLEDAGYQGFGKNYLAAPRDPKPGKGARGGLESGLSDVGLARMPRPSGR